MPNLGNKIRHKEGYFPVAPADTQQDIRTEMCLVMEELGVKIERQHHEVATAGQAEIDYRFSTAGHRRRLDDDLQIRRQERRQETRQDRLFHAQAALRRQRLRHAHPSILVEQGQAALCRQGIRRPQPDGAVLRRRFAQARQGPVRHLQPHHEQLQTPRAGLRSAGQPRLQRPQPQRRRPHPDLQRKPEGQAPRISSAGSGGESVSLLRRAAHGRSGRHPEQDQAGRTARQKHLRTAAGRTEEGSERGRQPQRSA